MKDNITDKELKLAARIDDLHEDAARPEFSGGGLLSMASGFLFGKVSRGLIAAALILFIGFHAWQGFNDVPQKLADLTAKQSEAGKAIAEANALGGKIGDKTIARATLEAELSKLQSDAQTAEADAEAQATIVNGATVRLQTIRADIAKTQAEADAAKAEADAQLQIITGIPAAIAQKQAEVEQAEASLAAKIQGDIFAIKTDLNVMNDPFFQR